MAIFTNRGYFFSQTATHKIRKLATNRAIIGHPLKVNLDLHRVVQWTFIVYVVDG